MKEADLLYDESPPVLLPCSICSRTFRPDVLDRHAKVCEKTASKKRRVFDSFKSRVSGTELEEFLGPAPLPGQAPKRPDKSPVKKPQGRPKWKETHENLIAVLRAARGAASGDPAAAAAAAAAILSNANAGNEQCPSCGRFFGPRAFDRHVQFCKEKTARIKTTPSKVSQAQERLEARTKYKAPLSLKPKLTTKEKYSPMLPRKVDSSETCSISSNTTNTKASNVNSVGRMTKPLPGKNNLSNFSRQSPTRCSERQRSTSPKKPLVSSSSKLTKEQHGKHPVQPKIKENLKESNDLRPKTSMKLSANQARIRNPDRKITDDEDDSQKPISKCERAKYSGRKSCMSSDDGTETDSMILEVAEKKKRGSPGSPVPKIVTSPAECFSPPKTGRDKIRMPAINDLSVNDESFGIRVAPCPHRTRKLRKKSAGEKNMKSGTSTPRTKTERVRDGGCKEAKARKKPEPDAAVPASYPRSSRIPKLVLREIEVKPETVVEDELMMDSLKRDKEKAAVGNSEKMRKWHNLSDLSTSDLLQMTDDFEFPSELDDVDLHNDLESQLCEIDEISQSTLWDLTAEDSLKSDDSAEIGEEVPRPQAKEEDECVVLHVAELQTFTDADSNMKLSVSEPCFATNYPEAGAVLRAMKGNSDIFVFDTPPKYSKKRTLPRKRNKVCRAKKVKEMPRLLAIREKTFLADDSPRMKRQKVEEKDPDKRSKIANIKDYFFGHISKLREEHREFLMTNNESFESRKKARSPADKPADKGGRVKKFEYFEIDKETLFDINTDKSTGRSRRKQPKSGGLAKWKDNQKTSFKSKSKCDNDSVKKFTICYSDEEFELLRQKKQEGLHQQKPKESLDIDLAEINDEPPDLPSARTSVIDSGRSAEGTATSLVNSPETVKAKPLDNIIEEEEHPGSTERSIEIEDFIVKRPNKSSIMKKSNTCLDELFPKPPEMVPLQATESTTAVPLAYVMNSLYDLKDEENVSGRALKKRAEKGAILPEIATIKRKEKKENSMSSLVQIWKDRKQMIQNGTLYKSQMSAFEKNKQQQQNSIQIALLPLVLTQKLSEVAGQFHNSKSKDESYDPFKQAERQMLALLSWPSTTDLKSESDNSHSPKTPRPSNRNLETSPTSAFSRYSSKEEHSPKELKENVNQQKVQNLSGRLSQSGKRKSGEYAPVYDAADDWEQIFEKHFDLNRNEMNDKMTRSVKSALDGLLKKNYSSSPERETSPSRKNRSELSENSVIEEVAYTSTPKKSTSRMSIADATFERTPGANGKNSYGRVTPPEDLSDSRKSNRNSGVSLSSLSFCSHASDTTLADEEIMRTSLEIVGVGKPTPRTSKRRFARSQSVFDERNKMLFAKTFDSHLSSSDENELLPTINDLPSKKSLLINSYPKSIPSHFPRSQSVMDGRCRGDGGHFGERDQISSPESGKNRKGKMSGDSAYSSLNRRSPRASMKAHQQEDRLSSSGSEHSLPPLNNDHALKPVSLNYDNTPSSPAKEQPYKMSKFCHECGSKYPVAVAKFCCECGVRRLII